MLGSPVWMPQHDLALLTTHPDATSWLLERGSLTERLRGHWGDASVQLLSEGLGAPLPHEAQRLGLQPTCSNSKAMCAASCMHNTPNIC